MYAEIKYGKDAQKSIDSNFYRPSDAEKALEYRIAANISSDRPIEEFYVDLYNGTIRDKVLDGTYRIDSMATAHNETIGHNGNQVNSYVLRYNESMQVPGITKNIEDWGWNIDPEDSFATFRDTHELYQIFNEQIIDTDSISEALHEKETDKQKVEYIRTEFREGLHRLFSNFIPQSDSITLHTDYGTEDLGRGLNDFEKGLYERCVIEAVRDAVVETYRWEDPRIQNLLAGTVVNVAGKYAKHTLLDDKQIQRAKQGLRISEKDQGPTAFGFRVHNIKDPGIQLKKLIAAKNVVVPEEYRLALKTIKNDKGAVTYEDVGRIRLLGNIAEDFWNEERSSGSYYQLSCEDLRKLETMRPIERKLLFDSGFQGDDLSCMISTMLPEVNGQYRFTADYNDYLHSLSGFGRRCGSEYFPGLREMTAYKYPKLREELENHDEYRLEDLTGHSMSMYWEPEDQKEYQAWFKTIENMLRDGISGNQIALMSDYVREGHDLGVSASPREFLTNDIVKEMRHNMYLHATGQEENTEKVNGMIRKEMSKDTHQLYECVKNNEVEKMFKDKYRGRVPMCVDQIKDMVDNGYMSATDAVNKFNVKKLSEFSGLSNPGMMRLAYEMDTNALTKNQKEVLECCVTRKNIDTIVDLKDLWEKPSAKWSKEFFAEFIEAANYINEYKAELAEVISRGDRKELSVYLKDKIEYSRAESDIRSYEKDYEYSFSENRVDIKGSGNISYLGDRDPDSATMKAYILDAQDPRNFTVGYDTGCCQHYNGEGEDCTYYATSQPNSGIWVIEEKDKVVAQAWVWTDEKTDTFVFDNIEFANDRDTNKYTDILYEYTKNLPYENVHMGVGYNKKMGHSVYKNSKNRDQIDMKKGEKISNPEYEDGEGGWEEAYSDYHNDACVLKRDGKMNFAASEERPYNTYKMAEDKDRDVKDKHISLNDALDECKKEVEEENKNISIEDRDHSNDEHEDR